MQYVTTHQRYKNCFEQQKSGPNVHVAEENLEKQL